MTSIDYNFMQGLEEIDRNARAYGFEVGRGAPLAEVLFDLSEDNPFMDPAWKLKMQEWNNNQQVKEKAMTCPGNHEIQKIDSFIGNVPSLRFVITCDNVVLDARKFSLDTQPFRIEEWTNTVLTKHRADWLELEVVRLRRALYISNVEKTED